VSYAFIINPAAGRARAGRLVRDLEDWLTAHAVAHVLLLTRAPGHAVQLAAEWGRRLPYVIAVGGDGTANEVLNGLLETPAALGVLPMGSGNDFAKMTGLSTSWTQALKGLLRARPIPTDYGTVRWDGSGERHFLNAVGVGFDAEAAYRARWTKRFGGLLGYVVAVLWTLCRWRAPWMHLRWEAPSGAGSCRRRYFFLTISNGACSGGGFYLAPHARIDDGLFDLCLVDALPFWRALWLMPRVMRGTHLGAREIELLRASRIEVYADIPLPVHADGEVLTRGAHALSCTLRAGQLPVLRMPAYAGKTKGA
jgi:diacylglycerol kinase (ATP)